MAQNSNSIYINFRMNACLYISILLLTALGICYFFQKRIRCCILWKQHKSSYTFKRRSHENPNYFSLLSFSNWKYRGEGNEFLAISIPERHQILRLRKSLCPVSFISNLKKWLVHNRTSSSTVDSVVTIFEKSNLEYYNVLMNLIGDCFVQPAEVVHLLYNEVNKINMIISPCRPEYRKKKHIGYACGSILTDYAYLPTEWEAPFVGSTFAIEVKPKQGWIAPNERIYPLCTYCLNQYIKIKNGETSAISDYCPMDLFSGNPRRMKYAVRCLINTPQNNLKIFQDGMLVYGEGSNKTIETVLQEMFNKSKDVPFTDLEELSCVIIKALLADLHKCIKHECTLLNTETHKSKIEFNDISRKVCNLHRDELPKGCVLNRILNIQKLDKWGANMVAECLEQPLNKNDIYGYTTAVVQRSKLIENCDCAECFFKCNRNNIKINNLVMVQQYLMSAIAKDCSIMLTFRKFTSTTNSSIPKQNIIYTKNNSYAFRVGVFDLYPKPVTCINKHVKKRFHFVDAYKKCISNKKICE